MTGTTTLAIADLRRDGGTQPRDHLNMDIAKDYAEAMADGAEFPPVIVFFDGTEYWLADGFHRVIAHEIGGFTHLAVDVRQGARRDAVLFSVGANAEHGYRRSNMDKRRAVLTMLNDPEWAAWSDREIARRCNVSFTLVASLRPPVTTNSCSDEVRTFVDRHGNASHMKVAAIGKTKPEMPVIAGKTAERKPRPDAAGLQETIGVGFASAITGLSARHVKELARTGQIEGAEKNGGQWHFPTASVKALVETSHPPEPTPEPEYNFDASRDLVATFEAIETIAVAGDVGAFLARWQADLGTGTPIETVTAASAWLSEFSAKYPEIETNRRARLATMLERIDADVIPR